MKLSSRFTSLLILVLFCAATASAQNSAVENLRSQLRDVQTKESETQARLKQIEEEMKPENIEKFFALNGSTRPEELREQRRRQLEKERDNLRSQLDQLAASRVRLETSLASAEAAAYRQSALPPDSYAPSPAVTGSSKTVKPKQSQRRARQRRRVRRRG